MKRVAYGLDGNFRANAHFLLFRWLLSTDGPLAPTPKELIELIYAYYLENQPLEDSLDLEPSPEQGWENDEVMGQYQTAGPQVELSWY